MSVLRKLYGLAVEPAMSEQDTLIPENPEDVPEDLYVSPDEGDQGHQEQLDKELGLDNIKDGPIEETPPDASNE